MSENIITNEILYYYAYGIVAYVRPQSLTLTAWSLLLIHLYNIMY